MSIDVQARAPANIALIKYMGKSFAAENRPTNSSLSWTLPGFETQVRLVGQSSAQSTGGNSGQPTFSVATNFAVVGSGWVRPDLSAKGTEKFIRHAQFCVSEFIRRGFVPRFELSGVEFKIESQNSFPSDCGLASSASSFAALTKAVGLLFFTEDELSEADRVQLLAMLSQRGSGSSCRSLFQPWSVWGKDGVASAPVNPLRDDLDHAVFIVASDVKEVSSSEAHLRVSTSKLFRGRVERAEERLSQLLELLSVKRAASERQTSESRTADWTAACSAVWNEMWDMHALFETAEPPFGYMNESSVRVLRQLQRLEKKLGRKLMITMDAGPNVHVLAQKSDDVLSELQALSRELGFTLLTRSRENVSGT